MRSRRFPCLMITGLALFVLVAGGILVALFATGLPGLLVSDPSYVLMASPLDHATVLAGAPVYLRVSAELSHRDFAGLALYVDGGRYALGQKMQPYAPKNTVSCTSPDDRYCGSADLGVLWMPAEPGNHTLSVCVFGVGQPTPAWNICTEPVQVAVVDPAHALPTAGTYLPQAGDTLPLVASRFGLPPELVIAANPGVDPVGLLSKDIPVDIPADPALAAPGASSASNDTLWLLD